VAAERGEAGKPARVEREACLTHGIADSKICAIYATGSRLKFAPRKSK
jgi:hypothetical protein